MFEPDWRESDDAEACSVKAWKALRRAKTVDAMVVLSTGYLI